jgi:4-hydroxy-3-polyprenylbenzoate decarboxylase
MYYHDLGEFIARLEQSRDLVRQTRGSRSLRKTDRALLVTNETAFPVITGLFASERRMAWALGVDSLAELSERMTAMLDFRLPHNLADLMKQAADLLRLVRPAALAHAPIHEIVHHTSDALAGLPLAEIASPLACLITHQPDGKPHLSVVRHLARAQQPDRLSILCAPTGYPPQARVVPAALVFGGDPAALFASQISLPPTIDPQLMAAWLRGRPTEQVRCLSHEIQVPARAEMVIEGWLETDTSTMQVTAITHRRDALLPASTAADRYWINKAAHHLFLPVLRLFIDDLTAVNAEDNVVIASIQHTYPGAAQRVMHGLWGMKGAMFARVIIIVDDDTDVHNIDAILARIIESVDWTRDLTIITGAVEQGDTVQLGSKIGIDATQKAGQPAPRRTPLNETISETINDIAGTDNWSSWCSAVVIVCMSGSAADLLDRLWTVCPDKHIILLDSTANPHDRQDTLRRLLTHVDWQHDLTIHQTDTGAYMGIDART